MRPGSAGDGRRLRRQRPFGHRCRRVSHEPVQQLDKLLKTAPGTLSAAFPAPYPPVNVWRVMMGRVLGYCWMALLLMGSAQVPGGCGFNRVEGGLGPEHFQFKVLVPMTATSGPDGWQAACVRVKLTNDNTGMNVMCQFEIGMPLRSHEMEISTALAQRVSAEQANLAAYAALSKRCCREWLVNGSRPSSREACRRPSSVLESKRTVIRHWCPSRS